MDNIYGGNIYGGNIYGGKYLWGGISMGEKYPYQTIFY
uniref:Uncharacterized protein n=1 Tax=viral metagenome TaxID=1070528 RepID=A0A6C0EJY3_9ZZZZ